MRTMCYLIGIAILAMTIGYISGCGGSAATSDEARQPVPAATQPDTTESAGAPMNSLPDPGRLTAYLDVDFGGFFFGDEHRTDLPRWNYRYIGENQVGLNPLMGDNPDQNTAVVMFYCDLATITHDSTLNLYWARDHDYGDVWVGFADYNENHWDWNSVPETNAVTFDPASHLMGGMLLFAVVITGTDEWILDHLWFGEVCPPLIAGIAPCGGREGETVTFEAVLMPGSGPVDEWSWNFGSSCADPSISNDISPEVTLLSPSVYTCEVHASNSTGNTDFGFQVVIRESWTTWEVDVVTGGFEDLITTSLALEPNGDELPHIACATTEDAYLCRNNGLEWETLWVNHSSAGDISISNTCLDVNSSGHDYLTYSNTYGNLNCFWYNGTEWQEDIVYEDLMPGYTRRCYAPRLVLDSNELPHVCYEMTEWAEDWDADYICYTRHTGLFWMGASVIDYSGGSMEHGTIEPMVPLALDSTDAPFVAWYDDDPGYLSLAYWDESWVDSVIDSTHPTGQISVALDSADRPHVAYIVSGSPSQIYHAVYDAGWDITPVPSAFNVDEEISLKLDSNDEPHIAYYNSVNLDLHMVYHDSPDWYNVRIDALGDVGQGCSLVIDNEDLAHVSYFDWSKEWVKYAVEPSM